MIVSSEPLRLAKPLHCGGELLCLGKGFVSEMAAEVFQRFSGKGLVRMRYEPHLGIVERAGFQPKVVAGKPSVATPLRLELSRDSRCRSVVATLQRDMGRFCFPRLMKPTLDGEQFLAGAGEKRLEPSDLGIRCSGAGPFILSVEDSLHALLEYLLFLPISAEGGYAQLLDALREQPA
jgi:hypothetical protein